MRTGFTWPAFLLGLAPAFALLACVVLSVVVSEKLHDGSLNASSVALCSLGFLAHFGLSLYVVSEKKRMISGFVTLSSSAVLLAAFLFLGYLPLAVLLAPFFLLAVAVFGHTQQHG